MDSNNGEEIAAKTGGRQMGPTAQNADGSSSGNSSNNSNGNSQGQRQMMAQPDANCDESSDETCEVPELPEDFDGEMPEMPSDMQEMGGFRGGKEFMEQDASSNGEWHPAAYLAMGAGSVILGILVSYTCFSKFFHKHPGETFNKASKFVWFVIVALVIAAGLCVLGYFIPVWIRG